MTAPLHLVEDDDPVALAREAADRVFDDPDAESDYEPADPATAAAAVARLAERWASAGGTVHQMRANARAGAEVLSDDPLQGLSEIIQNADDAEASTVRFVLDGDRLLVSHDGRPVVLKDVHFLASPWLTTKRGRGNKLGRFGIGMSTIHSIADAFELHCGPYHVRFGEPNLENVDSSNYPDVFDDPSATVLVVHLREGALEPTDLLAWAGKWDDSGLLFCTTVKHVIFEAGGIPRTLTLAWTDLGKFPTSIAGHEVVAKRREAIAPDGRMWHVATAEPSSPKGQHRANKKTDPTTPIGIALEVSHPAVGQLYAGLPLVPTRLPLRATAQLDPVTGRRALADRPWNDAVLALVADLWVEALLDMFDRDRSAAWHAVPLAGSVDDDQTGPAARFEHLVLRRARTSVPERLTFAVGDRRLHLDQLATHVPELDGLLTDAEVADLAGVDAALPATAMDEAGRWREVLDDWRENGADVPDPITMRDALDLIEDPDRSPASVIALTAAAIEAGLQDELESLICVITRAGERIRPPDAASTDVLVTRDSGLAGQLGMAVQLHDAHIANEPAAATVLAWLRDRDATIDADDPRAIISRLSQAGGADNPLNDVLDDQQLRSLRDAFETLTPADWSALGPGVGRAIRVDAFRFDSRRRKIALSAHPSEAYLSKAIDREPDSFHVAAGTTPGIVWLASRYGTVLRSDLGRAGLGAQKFFRVLGAETAPRILRHARLEARYTYERRRGVHASAHGSPPARTRSLTELGADYTLDDLECPDLTAVLHDIARDRKATSRRRRAAAVLATLGRAWPHIAESTIVDAAQAYHSWRGKGTTRSWWLWQAATIAWLDNSAARPTAPLELRLRTPGTVAVHGADDENYLHRSFDSARRDVLTALGVAGEPSTADLLSRLGELRDGNEDGDRETTSAAVVYRALAQRLTSSARLPGDLGVAGLRRAFNQGLGLVRTSHGWKPATQVLRGPPVFGTLRAFVPQVPDADRLWATLNIREPGIDDCIDVVGHIGRSRSHDATAQTVTLETLRLLATLVTIHPVNDPQRRRLAKLPLWTTHGWATARPIYAVDDPVLATGLAHIAPVWRPGGELGQFSALVTPCRLTSVVAVAHADTARGDLDEEATLLLRDAIGALHEDLARNDSETHSALRTSWADFEAFEVRVADRVRVVAKGLHGGSLEVDVAAYADITTRALFVTDTEAVASFETGGYAISALFKADRRQVAHAWLAAVQQARAGRAATEMELATERAAAEKAATEEELAEQLAALQEQAAKRRHGTNGGRPSRTRSTAGGAGHGQPGSTDANRQQGASRKDEEPPPPRVLVDPTRLHVIDPEGKIVTPKLGTKKPGRGQRRHTGLPDPKPGGATPRGRSAIRGYTDIEKETLGLQLASAVLASDADDMIDLRAQRGVGADAVNRLRQFFELKVYAGVEPDVITLEPSEISRAMSTPDFFLVVVSGVEGQDARPKVRVIVDPIAQLGMVRTSHVRFDGVRNSHSLIFELAPDPDA